MNGKYPSIYSDINRTLWSITVTPFQLIGASFAHESYRKVLPMSPEYPVTYVSVRSPFPFGTQLGSFTPRTLFTAFKVYSLALTLFLSHFLSPDPDELQPREQPKVDFFSLASCSGGAVTVV